MFTASVVVGRPYVTQEASLPHDMCPPQGYDAVLGEVKSATGRTRRFLAILLYDFLAAVVIAPNTADGSSTDRTYRLLYRTQPRRFLLLFGNQRIVVLGTRYDRFLAVVDGRPRTHMETAHRSDVPTAVPYS